MLFISRNNREIVLCVFIFKEGPEKRVGTLGIEINSPIKHHNPFRNIRIYAQNVKCTG